MSTGRRGRGHTVGERGAAQGGHREDGVAVGRGCPGSQMPLSLPLVLQRDLTHQMRSQCSAGTSLTSCRLRATSPRATAVTGGHQACSPKRA